MTARVFEPVAPQLRECLAGDVASIRVAMTVSGDGEIERVVVTPGDAQECIEPVVRSRSYPATQAGRQQVTHVVRREAPRE